MSTIRNIVRNTGVMILNNIISGAIGIVTVVCLTRYLGANDFGIYSFVFAYLRFFGIIVEFGINQILVRQISRDRQGAGRLIGNAIVMRIILSVIAIVSACGIISFLRYPFDTKLLVYVASLNFLLSFSGSYGLIFQVNLRMENSVLNDIFTSLLKLGLFLCLIFSKASLVWFIAAVIIADIPGVFIIAILSRRFVKPEFVIDFEIWRNILRESWPVVLTTVFIIVYMKADQLMLFHMKGAEAVGYYAAMVRLVEIFNAIPAAFVTSVFPLLSEYFVTSVEKLEKTYKNSFKYMATLIMPIVAGVSILSGPIVRIIYGEQFISAIPALKILIWSEVFVFLGTVHIYILISAGLQRLNLIFTSASAIANIILNLLLIPHYGIVGASVASVISYGLGIPISCSLRKTRKYGKTLIFSTVKPAIATGIMGCFTYFLFVRGAPLAVNIFVSAAIYLGAIISIKGLDKQDIEYIRRVNSLDVTGVL